MRGPLRMKRIICVLVLAVALATSAGAQNIISGTVSDAGSGNPIDNANLVLEGTNIGAISNSGGGFVLGEVPSGDYVVTASVVGYASQSFYVVVADDVDMSFRLQESSIEMDPLEVMASRSDEKSPVAVTDVDKASMSARLGSRDIPLVLDTTPSVFAIEEGGGAGDARVNLRGFNQRNVGIMINGVPVNDMENGWVYWSNWDGVGDATSSIQVQRGMSDVNLAVPAIGGTMNIVTDPTQLQKGGRFKQEVGSWGFTKSTLSYNTGLINDKFAFSGAVVTKGGDGYYKGTWSDASAYYFAASAQLNAKNRVELYVMGAPQRHGQNLYKQNAAVYDLDYAKNELGYEDAWVEDFSRMNRSGNSGRDYNQNYIPITGDYRNKDSGQYYYMYGENTGSRFSKSLLNERENFFHKPQVNLNHYLSISRNLRLSSVVYFSGGSGGGTGTYGSVKYNYHNDNENDDGFSRVIDFAETWNANEASDEGSGGILRNSINRQWTIGAVSKVDYVLNDKLRLQGGLDWRTAEIEHCREVRDLLGGAYYHYEGNLNESTDAEYRKGLGDKIAYWNTNTVDWLGAFLQTKYSSGPLSAFGMAGYSIVGYSATNHFKRPGDAGQKSENTGIGGGQFKTGVRYAVDDDLGVFANLGLVNKVPILDAAIDEKSGVVYEDPELEKFRSFEVGADTRLLERQLTLKANLYYTLWQDRTNTVSVLTQDGSDGYVFLKGLDAVHSGIEAEVAYQPTKMVRGDLALSLGNWKYTDDVAGTYTNWVGDTRTEQDFNYYIII